VDRTTLEAIAAARRERRAVAVVTDLGSGATRLVEQRDMAGDPLAEVLEGRFHARKSGLVDTAAGPLFINVHLPPPRLVIIGAVHISQALVPMAQLSGFDVEVIDPRQGFATPERFPGVDLIAEWPELPLQRRPLDAFTALAALTHDPKIDDLPLAASLQAGCFYVGALGSRKTHAGRLARLEANGIAPELLGRIHAPIGLPIGAVSPQEIAVAILAEVIAARRGAGSTGA
jgi:xanthine dehydrogenase accessory factor